MISWQIFKMLISLKQWGAEGYCKMSKTTFVDCNIKKYMNIVYIVWDCWRDILLLLLLTRLKTWKAWCNERGSVNDCGIQVRPLLPWQGVIMRLSGHLPSPVTKPSKWFLVGWDVNTFMGAPHQVIQQLMPCTTAGGTLVWHTSQISHIESQPL